MAKIAFCKYGGLAASGTEKYLQSLALLYKSKGHDIDYFYTDATPIEYSDYKHPDTCPVRKALLESNGINCIKIDCELRLSDNNYWAGNNFCDRFEQNKYDKLVTAGDGRREFCLLTNIPIIHTIHGSLVYNADHIKPVLLCKWQAEQWQNNGGDLSKASIIPPLIPISSDSYDWRERNCIPQDAFVFGLHQSPGVASLVSLQAFCGIGIDNVYYVIYGGDAAHRQWAREAELKNVLFKDHTSDPIELHSFIKSIDAYAHCREDGEVCSACLIEAMAFGKPIITHIGNGVNLGHLDQSDFIAYNVDEYRSYMITMVERGPTFNDACRSSEDRYRSYQYDIVAQQLLDLI